MKRIWKMQLVALMTVFALIGFGFNASAAEKKPYEYEFKAGSTTDAKFNGIAPLKYLEITFDENISEEKTLEDNIYARIVGETDKLDIINVPEIKDGKKLIVTFKNIEIIDYTELTDFELVIEKAVLRFDQTEEYVLPFEMFDVLPGFKAVFLDNGNAADINNKIFKNNPPRDIIVHVPQMYLEEIKTLHRFDGIVEGEQRPHLTNIDILANNGVSRLKVNFNNQEQHRRDLEWRSDVKGFTMGQAGIDAVEEELGETADKFELKAYNTSGRLLETRRFPLLINKEGNPLYTGYLPKPDKVFGQRTTLYELMADSKLLETIMHRIPVGELDSLGITYANLIEPEVPVTSLDQLKMALKNDNIKTIKLSGPIQGGIEVPRNVTIEGGSIIGDVKLGTGTENMTVRLKNMNIDGDLTVDVGAEGAVILDAVAVSGTTTIVSGGEYSVHLNNFTSANGIVLMNTTPLRIVTSTEVEKLTISGGGEVKLEGKFKDVHITRNTKLIMSPTAYITTLTREDGVTIIITGSVENIGERPDDIEIEDGDETVRPPISTIYGEGLPDNPEVWKYGYILTLLKADNGDDISGIENWTITENGFGNKVVAKWNGDKLFVEGLEEVESLTTKAIVLQGTIGTKVYEVIINITVK